MGAGKSTVGPEVAERVGRPFIDLDRDLEQDLGTTIPEFFEQRGEAEFRLQEERHAIAALRLPDPAVVALGGGAVQTSSIRSELRDRAFTVLLEVDPDTAWQRSAGGDRPLARDESEFRTLYERRHELYDEVADAHAYVADPDAAPVPVAGLLSPGYAQRRAGVQVSGRGSRRPARASPAAAVASSSTASSIASISSGARRSLPTAA